MDNHTSPTFFGLTSFRNQRKKFGIKQDDRRRHFYTIGKTGMGKSNLMENMAIQDIQNGNGLAYVDPHGEGADKLLDFVPPERIKDVVFLNPADLDFPIAFNVMEKVDFKYRHLVAGGLMGVFKKVWPDVWSARMEYILNNAILALLEYPDSTLLGVNRMLADPEYRKEVVSKITDPIVRSFWVTEYARYTQRYEIEATAAIQNKVGQFVSNALIRNIIGQTKSTINMRNIMDEGKILILDLSKGRIGEDNSRLLGALLITKLQLAAMSRVDIPEETRKDFYLYVDEFQNFATESFANILSEARKYRLNLIVGHQYISQMDEIVRDAVFGNVGTLAVFRIGAEDAEFLEKEFSPEFTAEDLVNLSKYNIYLKLMIDGVASHPFSAETLPPPIPLSESNRSKIIQASRDRYGIKRELVEEKITAWTGAMQVTSSPKPTDIGKANRPSTAPLNSSLEQPTLYDAICSVCGKPTKTIFQPQEGRPVYCKSCLKKIKNAGKTFNQQGTLKEQTNTQESFLRTPEKPESLKIGNIPFHAPRKKLETVLPQEAGKVRRKEINLSELKKALEASLGSVPKLPSKETAKNVDAVPSSADSPKKELEPTINNNVQKPPPQDHSDLQKNNKKGVIQPGQKVNL